MNNLNVEDIMSVVKEQPRLQEFVMCLYTGEGYKLNRIKMLDSNNRDIALSIIFNVYPEYKKDMLMCCKDILP